MAMNSDDQDIGAFADEPIWPGRSNRPLFVGARATPGVNVDRIDVAAGLRQLVACGYPETMTETHMVIQYALIRWSKGEEEAAARGAIDKRFYGIDLTSWYMVVAAARVAGDRGK